MSDNYIRKQTSDHINKRKRVGEKSCHWLGDKLLHKCIECGKEFRRSQHGKYKIKYCSMGCYDKNKKGLVSGNKHGMFGRTGELNPAWKGGPITTNCLACGKEFEIARRQFNRYKTHFCSQRCCGLWKATHSLKKDTDIERAIEKQFIDNNVPYKKQVNIKGIANVDFLVKDKIVVQCDGNYWHNMERRKEHDKNQDTKMVTLGYTIYRLMGNNIYKNPQKCIIPILQECKV